MKFFSWKIGRRFGIAILAAIAILVLFSGGLLAANQNRIIYGAQIAGLSLGGRSFSAATDELKTKIAAAKEAKIEISGNGQKWQIALTEFGLNIDEAASCQTISLLGRQNNFFTNISEQLTAFFTKQPVAAVFSFNPNQFNKALANFSSLETEPQNAILKYDASNDSLEVTAEKAGLKINSQKLLADLANRAENLEIKPIALSLENVEPAVNVDAAQTLLEPANEIIGAAPYKLTAVDFSGWTIDKKQVAAWLEPIPSPDNPATAQLSLSQTAIKKFLASSVAPEVNQSAVSAKLTEENGEIKTVNLAQEGRELDITLSAEAITEGVLARQKEIKLSVVTAPPAISNDSLKYLGITARLGMGESNFAGSATNRKKNIALGAQKLNGLLIKPGEEFSFIRAIGEIDAEHGWYVGYVLKDNQTILEYGGGICQVSTTLFRAAVNSGLKITERHAHAIPLNYYNPPGFDATIYPPWTDLSFLNDTGNNILLQSRIAGTKLYFEIYGTNDSRQVKIIGPKTTYRGANGSLKATLTQQIWRDGNLDREETFNSSYKPVDSYPIVTSTPAPSPTP